MAVYTKVSEQEVIDLLRRYEIGAFKTLTGIKSGVENTNYLLETSRDRYILTLYEKRVRREDLPFFLGLMSHVAKKGIDCPQPIADLNGAFLTELANRPAALVSFLHGRSMVRVLPSECAEVGRALAAFHLAALDFPISRPNTLGLSAWQPLFDSCSVRADEVEPGLAQFLQTELAELKRLWPMDLPRGVIHADLFTDNVFFNGIKFGGMFDFYFACNDLLAYDLAVCLNAWCFENRGAFNITKARAIINAYREVRPMSAAELAALHVLARGSAMRFLLTRLYDWLNCVPDALVKPKNPLDFLARLQFHQKAQGIDAYGLSPTEA